MEETLNKISLAASTYRQAWLAIGRQQNFQKLVEVQNGKLLRLIKFAAGHVKYYRELFEKEGISPAQIRSREDLATIPILTKQQLRERFWDFLPERLSACRVSRTSGSTGVPVCILSDRNSRCFNSAAVIRYRQALGVPFIGRAIITPLKREDDPARKAHWTYLQGIHKTYYVNPYTDSVQEIAHARKILTKLKNPILIGITPALRRLAYCVRDSILPQFRPAVILTTGEVFDLQVRCLLESIFAAKVADIYACNEAGDVAWQCLEGDGYHINVDNVIVEIIKDGKPVELGQVGEVVITNLNRYAMPIIRYKNGDLAKFSTESCLCGCKLPMLAEIIGRSGEDITLPSGKVMPWNQLKGLMNHPHIRQFQLIQNADGSFLVKYIKEPHTDEKPLERLILERYQKLLGDCLPIKVELVNQIPPAISGKSKLVISHYKRELEQGGYG